jgi:hypothetical protein
VEIWTGFGWLRIGSHGDFSAYDERFDGISILMNNSQFFRESTVPYS